MDLPDSGFRHIAGTERQTRKTHRATISANTSLESGNCFQSMACYGSHNLTPQGPALGARHSCGWIDILGDLAMSYPMGPMGMTWDDYDDFPGHHGDPIAIHGENHGMHMDAMGQGPLTRL